MGYPFHIIGVSLDESLVQLTPDSQIHTTLSTEEIHSVQSYPTPFYGDFYLGHESYSYCSEYVDKTHSFDILQFWCIAWLAHRYQ